MLTITYPSGQVAPLPPLPPKRFTVDEYHLMIRAGMFADDERYELLEGWVVPKMTRNAQHDGTIELVNAAWESVLPDGWRTRVQLGITMADSEPEPDVAVVRGTVRTHLARHPVPSEIALVIEVADSSLSHDRNFKGRIYARAALAEYWIVNLVDPQVEVYTDPTGDVPDPEYRQRRNCGPADEVAFVLAGQELTRVRVADLLP